MSPDATGNCLIWEQNNLMFDLRFKRRGKKVTIWCTFQLAFFLFPFLLPFLCKASLGLNTLARVRCMVTSLLILHRESLLASDSYLLRRSYPSLQMAIPCKTNKSSIRLEMAPLLKMRSIEDLSLASWLAVLAFFWN